MRAMRWATCLWPGLPQLWLEGSFSGLALAIGFALLFNLVLVSTCAWSELLSAPLSWGAWGGVTLFWLVSAWLSLRWLKAGGTVTSADADDALFRDAQAHYLRASWFDAEVALGQLLERHPRDAEARLLLATLFRHTGRWDEALAQLQVLEKLDGAVKWQMEMRQERELLAELRREATTPEGSENLPWADIVPFVGAA